MTPEQASSVTPGLERLYTQARNKRYFIQETTDNDGRFKAKVGILVSYEEIGFTPNSSVKDELFDYSCSGIGSTRGAAVRRAMVAWETHLGQKP